MAPDTLTPPVDPDPSTPAGRLAIVASICADIADGGTVNATCEKYGIRWRDLWNWKAADPELERMFARARSSSGITWADRATLAAQAAIPEGQESAFARIRVGHYEWRASKASPREFGDKLDLTTDGGALGSAVVILPALDALPIPGADSVQFLDTPHGRAAVVGSNLAAQLAAQLAAMRRGNLPATSIEVAQTGEDDSEDADA